MKHNDDYFIDCCRELAQAAAAKGNAPVGAVLVKDGVLIAEAEEAGVSKNDITCHAEIEVIRKAVHQLQTKDLSDCILYSTHEPCVMCSYSIRFHNIKKVVFLHTVNHLGGFSSTFNILSTDKVPAHWGLAPEIVLFKENKK